LYLIFFNISINLCEDQFSCLFGLVHVVVFVVVADVVNAVAVVDVVVVVAVVVVIAVAVVVDVL
jgi:hypothetical protein